MSNFSWKVCILKWKSYVKDAVSINHHASLEDALPTHDVLNDSVYCSPWAISTAAWRALFCVTLSNRISSSNRCLSLGSISAAEWLMLLLNPIHGHPKPTSILFFEFSMLLQQSLLRLFCLLLLFLPSPFGCKFLFLLSWCRRKYVFEQRSTMKLNEWTIREQDRITGRKQETNK